MRKPTVTRLFVGGLIAFAVGVALAAGAGLAVYQGGGFVMASPDVVGFRGAPLDWAMLALMGVGGLVLLGSAVVYLVAWIGALVNSARLADKTWFVVVLVTGLLGVGFAGMLAYVIAAPDAYRRPPAVLAPPSPVRTRAGMR